MKIKFIVLFLAAVVAQSASAATRADSIRARFLDLAGHETMPKTRSRA